MPKNWNAEVVQFGKFVASAAVSGVVGWIAVTSLGNLIQNSGVRDVGILVIWVLVVATIGVFGYRILTPTKTVPATPLAAPSTVAAPAVASSGPWSPEVTKRLQVITADTRIGNAFLQLDPKIPKVVLDTTLGEMALLRRMAQVRSGTIYEPLTGDAPTPRTRCEDVLTAAGSTRANQSMIRLIGAGLLHESAGECRCTDSGRQILSDFTTYLTKDPLLVAAYRRVTPRINRTIMLDGRPLES